jgi:hypothetical protein
VYHVAGAVIVFFSLFDCIGTTSYTLPSTTTTTFNTDEDTDDEDLLPSYLRVRTNPTNQLQEREPLPPGPQAVAATVSPSSPQDGM